MSEFPRRLRAPTLGRHPGSISWGAVNITWKSLSLVHRGAHLDFLYLCSAINGSIKDSPSWAILVPFLIAVLLEPFIVFSVNRLSWRSVWKGSERRRPDRGQGLLGKVFSSLPRLSLLFTAAVKTQEALASHFGLHTAVFNEWWAVSPKVWLIEPLVDSSSMGRFDGAGSYGPDCPIK